MEYARINHIHIGACPCGAPIWGIESANNIQPPFPMYSCNCTSNVPIIQNGKESKVHSIGFKHKFRYVDRRPNAKVK